MSHKNSINNFAEIDVYQTSEEQQNRENYTNKKFSIVVSVHNDENVLKSSLLRSPVIKKANFYCQKDYPTVAIAYNDALDKCYNEVTVFTHPDVYFPDTWEYNLDRTLHWLEKHDPNWGVIGLYGVNRKGQRRGFTYSTGRGGFLGMPFYEPKRVRTLDEFVFAIRTKAGLYFDTKIPGAQSQLCTTDLCLEAEKRGMSNYAIPVFAIHNSNRWSQMPIKFWNSYLYIRRKWKQLLPIEAPYAHITKCCIPMWKGIIKKAMTLNKRYRSNTRVSDPDKLYKNIKESISKVL